MDYSKKNRAELIAICKEKRITGYSGKKKSVLLDMILSKDTATISVRPIQQEIDVKNAPSVNTEMSSEWHHILKYIKYNNTNNFILTAEMIKGAKSSWTGAKSQFEPRLLAYQPSALSRPECFKEHGLCIFPVKNGTYILTKSMIYKELDYSATSITYIKKDDTSLILKMGDSETSLIDNLRYSGVFEREELLGEPITHGSLLNGRHRCTMELMLGDTTIAVDGVQYETDACYESKRKVLVNEGKSSPKQIDSFNIRQLYNPYREIRKIVGDKKEIIPVFIHKLQNDIHVWKYTFEDYMRPESIKQLGHYIYRFSS
jgi:hypothetical protein